VALGVGLGSFYWQATKRTPTPNRALTRTANVHNPDMMGSPRLRGWTSLPPYEPDVSLSFTGHPEEAS
jgi:hypothetical protein